MTNHRGQERARERPRTTYTLVKLSVAAACHGWVVTAIDLSDVIALDVCDLVHGQVSCKGNLKGGGLRRAHGWREGVETSALQDTVRSYLRDISSPP